MLDNARRARSSTSRSSRRRLAAVRDRLPALEPPDPGPRRLGRAAAARRGRLRDVARRRPRSRSTSPTPPTTSTCSTPAARRACRRACCGATRTSSTTGSAATFPASTAIETVEQLREHVDPRPRRARARRPAVHARRRPVDGVQRVPPRRHGDPARRRPGASIPHGGLAHRRAPRREQIMIVTATPSPVRCSRRSTSTATTSRRSASSPARRPCSRRR